MLRRIHQARTVPLLRIKLERLLRGWSQTDAARLAHMMQQELSLVEQGRLIPRDNQLERLSRLFGLPASALLKPVVTAPEPENRQEVTASQQEAAR